MASTRPLVPPVASEATVIEAPAAVGEISRTAIAVPVSIRRSMTTLPFARSALSHPAARHQRNTFPSLLPHVLWTGGRAGGAGWAGRPASGR